MQGIEKVAVIGAGVSGICAAVHLNRFGLEVTVLERGSKAGGVWVYDDRVSLEPSYPSVLPSVGDSPAYVKYLPPGNDLPSSDGRSQGADSPLTRDSLTDPELALLHAPPGPAYAGLTNNVSTIEMELRAQKWKPGTAEHVHHTTIQEYLEQTAHDNGIEPLIRFGTRVDHVEKNGSRWKIQTSKIMSANDNHTVMTSTENFDAVVVATGHYHACHVPDTPGLREWKQNWPDRVQHSKSYRDSNGYEGKSVLIVGSGASAYDIAREVGAVAKTIYQVSRGGEWDLPESFFPSNSVRIGEIDAFESASRGTPLPEDGSIPGTVHLKSGQNICGVHNIILCTGYHMSYPFLTGSHADNVEPEDADERILVTKDGQITHNLHKDIFYIPDPTLTFIGVPYHVATFTLFEFQTIAVAAVYSGHSALPSEADMRTEYQQRLSEKGSGRAFHSLRGPGVEIGYVNDLMELVNQNPGVAGQSRYEGHTDEWLAAYASRAEKMKKRLESRKDVVEKSSEDIE